MENSVRRVWIWIAFVMLWGTTTLVVPAEANKFSITPNLIEGNTIFFQGSIVISNQIASAGNVSWFVSPVDNLTVRQLYQGPLRNLTVLNKNNSIYNYVRNDTISKLSVEPMPLPQVYIYHHADYIPYVTYFADIPLGNNLGCLLECNLTTILSSAPFNCSARSPNFELNFDASISCDDQNNVQLNIWPSLPVNDPRVRVLLTIAYSRFHAYSNAIAQAESIADSNSTRQSRAKIAVGFLYAFIMLSFVVLTVMVGLYQSWAYPVCHPCASYHKCYLTFWIVAPIILMIIVVAAGGLKGVLILAIIYGIWAMIIAWIYCSVRSKQICCSCYAKCCVHCNKCAEGGNEEYPLSAEMNVFKDKSSSSLPESSKSSTELTKSNSKYVACNRLPSACNKRQRNATIVLNVLFVVFFLVCIAIFFIWKVDDYYVYSRDPIYANPKLEYIPSTVGKGLLAAYVFPGTAKKLQLNDVFFPVTVEWCGKNYQTELTSDSDKYDKIYVSFIQKYDIDMSEYNPSDYRSYPTVNDWFKRPLALGVRPISDRGNDNVALSPADARLMLFPQVPRDSSFWIKGENFDVETLIGDRGYDSKFIDGSMAIVRLAPQDYHRFHSPVAGKVIDTYDISGTLYSVSADGITSGNGAIYNQRKVLMINTLQFGKVAFIAIGATCVGSIQFTNATDLKRGDELGYFQFGGSTVVLMFPKDTILFDDDILFHSKRKVESLMKMGTRIGIAIKP